MAKSFTLVKKGYDPDEVQAYIRKLEQEINDYKQKERFITEALINARAEGQKIIMEAERKGAMIEQENLRKLDYMKTTIRTAKQKLDTFNTGYSQFILRFTTAMNDDVIKGLHNAINDLQSSMEITDSATKGMSAPAAASNVYSQYEAMPTMTTPAPAPAPVEEFNPYAIPENFVLKDKAEPVAQPVFTQPVAEAFAMPTVDSHDTYIPEPILDAVGTPEVAVDTLPYGSLQDIVSFHDEDSAYPADPSIINASSQLKPNNSYSLFSKIDEYERKHVLTNTNKPKDKFFGGFGGGQ